MVFVLSRVGVVEVLVRGMIRFYLFIFVIIGLVEVIFGMSLVRVVSEFRG